MRKAHVYSWRFWYYYQMINSTRINWKRFLYENELINGQNDFSVNKQIFIFLFSTCIVYIGTTSKINKYNGYLRRGRCGDVTKHNVEFKHRHHWQMLNHYFEKNYTYINDINLVWRGGGGTINTCTTDWKKPNTSIAKKCMYSGLKKLVLKYAMLIQ